MQAVVPAVVLEREREREREREAGVETEVEADRDILNNTNGVRSGGRRVRQVQTPAARMLPVIDLTEPTTEDDEAEGMVGVDFHNEGEHEMAGTSAGASGMPGSLGMDDDGDADVPAEGEGIGRDSSEGEGSGSGGSRHVMHLGEALAMDVDGEIEPVDGEGTGEEGDGVDGTVGAKRKR